MHTPGSRRITLTSWLTALALLAAPPLARTQITKLETEERGYRMQSKAALTKLGR